MAINEIDKTRGEGETYTNHVENALTALAAGKPVERATTKAYGCSVKYGS